MSRNVVAVVSSVLFVALAAVLVFVPVPYIQRAPGLTLDLLGKADKGPVVEVVGYPAPTVKGALMMTTVSTTSVDSRISLVDAMFAYLAQDSDVMPRDVVYPPGKSDQQVKQEAVAMMDTSRDSAVVAALRAAGESVSEMPMVVGLAPNGPAKGLLQPGDLIESVDDSPVKNRADVASHIQKRSAGKPVVFRVIRNGAKETVTVVTAPSNSGKAIVGINLGVGFVYGPKVTFRVDPSIVGPSAGLTFALAVYQRLTETDLVGKLRVAGTGAIDPTGKVSAISGVREKIKGAERSKADVFLLPTANCRDIGDLKTNVRLVPVPTLRDAISTLQLLRSDARTPEVPSCG